MSGVALVACCDINKDRAAAFAEKWSIPRVYTGYKTMFEKEKLHGISNVAVDSMHAPISIAAMKKGIAILCEKPLATTLADAKKMLAVAKKTGVINMVDFTRRGVTAVQGAAAYIAKGNIGRIMHVEASYLQSWLSQPAWGDWRTIPAWTWRLSTKHGSAGVLGDLGCHIYDTALLLCGDISEIACTLKTFDKGGKIGPYLLDANDSFVSTVRFKNGAIGSIHSTRWATGHMNSIRVRVYGDKGAVEIDLDRAADEFQVVRGAAAMKKGLWTTVKCARTPTMWERFVTSIRTKKNDPSDFANGVKVQAYQHYSVLSDTTGRPVKVTL